MLWNRSLVIVDEETKSLWSHLLGECMRGELKGAELERIPSLMTDWGTWKNSHPDTTVVMLTRTARVFTKEFYRNPDRFVVGLSRGRTAKAWPFDQLQKQPVFNDIFAEKPVVIIFDRDTVTATIFYRNLDTGTLTFEQRGKKLIDLQTKSTWNRTQGIAIAGPLKGKTLKPAIGIVSFRNAWEMFYPKSTYAQAGRN